MKVITLVNEKGGVGKTTLAVHLAAGMAARGKRVMLIDTDPQGHATVRLGMAKGTGFYDLMVRDAPFKDVARGILPEKFGFVGEKLPTGKLWVVPSNVETRNVATSIDDSWRVWVRLQELLNRVDLVIFDTSPTPSLLHGALYLASDALIVPTQLTYSSFDGLVGTMSRLKNGSLVRERNGMSAVHVLGIVPMMYEKRTIEHTENLDNLRKQFGTVVWEPMAKRILWQETESSALPVWALEPNHDASMDAYHLLDQFEGAWDGAEQSSS